MLVDVAAQLRPDPPGALEVATDGRGFRIAGGDPVSLVRRGAERRLLLALTRQRLERPGIALGWEALFGEGWPGQRSAPESARSRVYVTVAALRKHGLRDALHTSDEGYFLDPALPVSFSTSLP
jgi:hypothetical protein